MTMLRALLVLSLCSAAARADELASLIERPVTLPNGAVDLTLHGTYTNWGGNAFAGALGSLEGETLALGADFGLTEAVQFGVGLALPLHPGAGFGSVFISALFSGDPRFAMRADAGFESIGANGDTPPGTSHIDRYFGGFGAVIKVPITPTVAFVTGRNGVLHFGHFNNVGNGGTGVYAGATGLGLTELSSDFLVFGFGNNGSGSNIGINLPAGLLLQPDPHFAVTLQAGYSVAIGTSGSTQALHFFPIGLEAVVTPSPLLDIGARFYIDGYVASSGGGNVDLGYFDLRTVMLWFRVHV